MGVIFSKGKAKVKKYMSSLRAIMLGQPSTCLIESKCRTYAIIMEGYNHIGTKSIVANTSLGTGSGISRDSIVEATKIGRYSSLAPELKIISGQHPTTEFVSTHPAFYSNRAQMGFTYVNTTTFEEFRYADRSNRYKVVIGNDVWIGSNVLIMEGINIGDGAIVAAGSVVTRNISPYAIVGGVPARVIGYRFATDDIDFLLKLKWWDKGEEWIRAHAQYFDDIKYLRGTVESEMET